MPTDVLLTGKRATISGTLLYFDDTVLSSAMNLGGGSEGGIAAQGEFILGGSNDATLVVGGTTAGAITYTFAHAYLASLSRTVSSVETRVPFVFNAIWNGSGSLYTTS